MVFTRAPLAFWVSDGTILCWCLAGDEAESWAGSGEGVTPLADALWFGDGC